MNSLKRKLLRNSIINGFFLSDRIYWIYWIFSFSQFPEETEKEESRCAGKIENRILHFLWSGIISISGLTPKTSPAAFGGVGFLPFRLGRAK
jgi:hypothetical protein